MKWVRNSRTFGMFDRCVGHVPSIQQSRGAKNKVRLNKLDEVTYAAQRTNKKQLRAVKEYKKPCGGRKYASAKNTRVLRIRERGSIRKSCRCLHVRRTVGVESK